MVAACKGIDRLKRGIRNIASSRFLLTYLCRVQGFGLKLAATLL